MKSNIGLFLLKAFLFALPIFILFAVLFRAGFYPIMTNSGYFDHKMFEAEKRGVKKVTLLSIGSSITVYELNSKIIKDSFPIPYYNFSSWGLQMADTRMLLAEFATTYDPKYVLVCSSIGDFISPNNDTYSNYTHANRYIRNNFPELLYFWNYNSLYQIAYRKSHLFRPNEDNWGGATLTIPKTAILPEKWNEHDIFPTGYTEGAYKELDSLGAFLKARHITFIFAQAPIKASYTNTPSRKKIVDAHFDRCRSIVGAQDGIYLNYYNTSIFTDSLFFDQYHLQASGAVIFTREISADLKKIIR